MYELLQVSGNIKLDPGEFGTKEIRVGRDRKNNDVVIPDTAVSRNHARIFYDDGRCIIEDLQSRNSTLINGAPVEQRALKQEDRIQIGSVAFLFREVPGDDREMFRLSPLADIGSDLSPGALCAATQVGAIKPGARDLSALERDHENLMALYTVGKEINDEIENTEELLTKILKTAIQKVEAKRGFLALKDLDSGALMEPEVALNERGAFLDDIVVPTTITQNVFETHESILTEDAWHDATFKQSESVVQGRILSAMCVPLLYRKEALGVLYVDNCAQTASFSERDFAFLTCIADLAGIAIGNANLYRDLRKEYSDLQIRLHREVHMVGKSDAFQEVMKQIKIVAESDITVLVTGESGTGKELVARAVHNESEREGSFIAVNCAAIPDTLIEAELFGYSANSGIAGAAPQGKPGKFELADKGTIFLDEIGDMKLDVQATILRVLQDRVVERLGGTEPTQVDVRIVAATNKELDQAIEEGRFRQDLFYRLNQFTIPLQPLRNRPVDIEPLVDYFLQRYSVKRKSVPRVTAKAMNLLKRYPWPGNVRELDSAIRRALLYMTGRNIGAEALDESIREGASVSFPTLREVEEQHIRKVMDGTGRVISEAARVLDIARKTLYEKMKLYGIEGRS